MAEHTGLELRPCLIS